MASTSTPAPSAPPATAFIGHIYSLLCDDGHYYIGSTKTDLKYRLYAHKQASIKYPDRKVYNYINSCGWDKVIITNIEDVSCNSKEDLLLIENKYIKEALNDPSCLNEKKAHLSEMELKEQRAQYIQQNKEKIDKYHANYRIENAEKRCAYSAQYAADHPEEVKGRRRKYYEENKEEILNKQKQYVEANKDHIREAKKAWSEQNKEKIQAARKNYAERNKEAIAAKGCAYYEANREVIRAKQNEYNEQNRDATKEYMKQYRETHKDILNKTYPCECGGTFLKRHEGRHMESKKHKLFINNTASNQ